MVPEASEREASGRLHAEEAFACVRCGKGFAPPSLVAKMIARLEGHWMYRSEQELARLKMCRDCRVRDLFAGREREERP